MSQRTPKLLPTLCAALLLACPAQVFAAGGRGGGARAQQRRARAAGAASRYVKQEEVLTFNALGRVRVRAVEVPHQLPRLEFAAASGGRRLLAVTVGTSDREAFIREPGDSLINSLVRFRALHVEGFPAPLVLAVAVRPGGSDHGFEATLVGEVNGRLKVLTPRPPPLVSLQGGVFVGDLGGGRGPGFAAWTFIWEDGAHYDEHRYLVKLYPLGPGRAGLRGATTMRSKGKHRRGADALAELGLPRYENLLDSFPAISDYRN
jgi:hypothetical protein